MDTWWQTETGMHMIAPLPSADLKPGSATKPVPGVSADVVDDKGNPVPLGTGGNLVKQNHGPLCLELSTKTRKSSRMFTGMIYPVFTRQEIWQERTKKDISGYREDLDDVLKIAGHRIGTSEVESAFVSNPAVVEAAVIGKADPIKGEVIKAFLILKEGYQLKTKLIEELNEHVRYELGPVAVIGELEEVDSLPKTRSGKIMRRILKS